MRKRVRASAPVRQRANLTHTVGIDVDRDMLVVATYRPNVDFTPVDEYPNTPQGHAALVAHLTRGAAPQLICLESTGPYSLAAYDALSAAGLPTTMINPLTVKALLRVEGKSDRRDAATLARLAAGFDLRKSNIPDARQRDLRILFRQMDDAGQELIRTAARLNAVLVAAGCSIMQHTSGAVRYNILAQLGLVTPEAAVACHPRASRRAVLATYIPADLPGLTCAYARSAAAHLRYLEQLRHDGAAALAAYATLNQDWLVPALRYVRTVPLTTDLLALRLVAEMGANFTERYPTAERFCAAVGVSPATEVSGGKLLKVADTHGNQRLLAALANVTKAALLRQGTPLETYYRSLRGRMGHSKALLATCHVIAEGWYHCTKLQVEWDPLRALGKRTAMPTFVDRETGEIRL